MGLNLSNFPVQSKNLHKRVLVALNEDFADTIGGTIVRMDGETPFITLIRLDTGQYVADEECQYAVEEDIPFGADVQDLHLDLVNDQEVAEHYSKEFKKGETEDESADSTGKT